MVFHQTVYKFLTILVKWLDGKRFASNEEVHSTVDSYFDYVFIISRVLKLLKIILCFFLSSRLFMALPEIEIGIFKTNNGGRGRRGSADVHG